MKVKITIPHWSTFVPQNFLRQFVMPVKEMKKHSDFGTEKIFGIKKYPALKATASRFVVDLNRKRSDVGPDQGVVIKKAWDGSPVLKKELSKEEVEQRLTMYYDPFLKELKSWLGKKIFLLDGHSMDSTGNSNAGNRKKDRAEICIATSYGETCSKEIIEIFKEGFEQQGYFVAKNNPYSGKRAAIIHLAKQEGSNAIELEINKKIYMNEKNFELNNQKIFELKNIISNCLKKIEKLD